MNPFNRRRFQWLNLACGVWFATLRLGAAQTAGENWNEFDESFTTVGSAWVARDNQPGRVLALAEQSDGRVLVAGGFDQLGEPRPGLVRLAVDGGVDASFVPILASDQGVVTVRSVVVLEDGRIVIAGNFLQVDGVARLGLARLDRGGRLDASFDPGAGPEWSFGSAGAAAVRWLLPGPEGTLYVGGWFDRFDGHARAGVVRLMPDGSVDPGFVPGIEPGAGFNVAARTSDGGLVVGGGPNRQAGLELVKLRADGVRDPGFRSDVGISGSLGAGPAVRALAVDGIGRIYVGGDFAAVAGETRHRLARLKPDGTLDAEFDPSGLPDNVSAGGSVTWLGLDAAGAVWVAGSSGDPLGVAKYYFGRLAGSGNGGAESGWLIRELETVVAGLEGGLVLRDGRILVRGHIGQRRAGSKWPGLARIFAAFEGSRVQWEVTTGKVAEREPTVTLRLVRTGSLAAPLTLDFATRDGLAKAGMDFLGVTGKVAFAAGEDKQDVVVRMLPDGLREGLENFSVELLLDADSVPAVLLGRARDVWIEDDDSGFEFAEIEALEVREGSSVVELRVRRVTDMATAASVGYRTTPYGAQVGDDYLGGGEGRLEFAAEEMEKTIRFELIDDAVAERNEEFAVSLLAPSEGASLGTVVERRVRIVDNEMEFNFQFPGGNIGEPLYLVEGMAAQQVTVQRIGDLRRAATVRVVSVDSGGAVAGQDYVEVSGVLEFAENVATRTVSVRVLDNRSFNASTDTRSFLLTLRDPTGGAVIGPAGERRVFISDNETGFAFVSGNGEVVAVNEGVGTRSIVVRRGFDSPQPVSVGLRVIEDSARRGVDFVYAGGDRLTFEPGQMTNRIEVTILDDAEFELEEHFSLQLENIEAGTRVDWPNIYGFLIRDDEPGFSLPQSELTAFEGGRPASVRVTRSRGTDRAATVHVSTRDGTARAGVDYVPLQTTLHFAAGETSRTVNVELLDDAEPEPDEYFVVVLSYPSSGSGIAEPRERSVTIRDNENWISLGNLSFFRESQGQGTVTVQRSGALDREAQVELVAVPGTALEGPDYLPFATVVTFSAGEARQTVTLPLVNDDVPEQPEWLRLRLLNPSPGAALGNGSTELHVTLFDDDVPRSVIEFESATVEADELDGFVRLWVKRSTALGSASAEVILRAGTATPGRDYLPQEAYYVGFGYGQMRTFIDVPIVEDVVTEGDESFDAVLRSPSSDPNQNAVSLGELKTTTVTLHDAGQVIEFASPTTEFLEAAMAVELTVRRRGDADGTASVRWRTLSREAVGGADFEEGGGVVEFAPGVREAKASVRIRDDYFAEGEERFALALEAPEGGAVLGKHPELLVSIMDDERVVGTDQDFAKAAALDLKESPVVAGFDVGGDGSMLLSGTFTLRGEETSRHALRLGPDGKLDRAYASGLSILLSAQGASFAKFLPDGRALVGVQVADGSSDPWRIVRLERDGRLDPTFGGGSVGFSSENSWSQLRTMVIQPDGRILVGGEFNRVGRVVRRGIVRLTADGQVDPTFDPGEGPLRLPPSLWGDTNRYTAVAVLALAGDGRIYVGGEFTSYAGAPRFGLARLQSDGRLDPGFDPAARFAVVDSPSGQTNTWVHSLAVQGDGRLLVMGSTGLSGLVVTSGVIRLDETGTLDPGWDAGILPGGSVSRVLPTQDGRVWLAGQFAAARGGLRRGLALLRSDGSVDPDFAGLPPGIGLVDQGTVDADGRWVGIGWRTDATGRVEPTIFRTVLARSDIRSVEFGQSRVRVGERAGTATLAIQRSGDSSTPIEIGYRPRAGTAVAGTDYQDTAGTVTLGVGENRKEVPLSWVLDDGVVEGNEAFELHLERVSPGVTVGEFDTATVEIVDDEVPVLFDMAFAPEIEGRMDKVIGLADGRVLVLGEILELNGVVRRGIARLLPDGSVDTAFDAQLGLDAEGDCCVTVRAAAMQSDGSLVIAGYFTRVAGQVRRGLARLLPDGSLDTRFEANLGEDWNWVNAVAAQPDGRIVVAGWGARLLRFNADGSQDRTFAGTASVGGDVNRLWALPDGRLIAFGYFESWGGVDRYRIVRLDADGTLDSSFGLTPTVGYQLRIEQAVHVMPDGSVLVSAYGDGDMSTLVRLRPDGLVDASFRPDLRPFNFVGSQLSAQSGPDGTIWVLGRANPNRENPGDSPGWLVRLRGNGSTDPGFEPVRLSLLPGGWWGFGFQTDLSLSTAPPDGVWITTVKKVGSIAVGPVVRVLGSPSDSRSRSVSFAAARELAIEGINPVAIEVRRFGDTSSADTVVLRVAAGGSAQAGRDFVLDPTLIRFEPLEVSRVVQIPLADNLERGADTTIALELVEPSTGVRLGRNRMTVTLYDDESRAALDITFRPELELDYRSVGSAPSVQRLRPTPGGGFDVWGSFQTVQGVRREGYARLFADGRVDTNTAIYAPFWPQFNGDAAVLADGRRFEPRDTFLALVRPDGQMDPGFRVVVGGGAWTVGAIASAADGRYMVGGWFTSIGGVTTPGLARLLADGTPDPAFKVGRGIRNSSGGVGEVRWVHVLADGKIIVAGSFATVDGASRPVLARLLADGTPDLTYLTGAATRFAGGYVSAFAVAVDGSVFLAGSFPGIRVSETPVIVKIGPDGTLDRVLDIGSGPRLRNGTGQTWPGNITSLALDSTGGLWVGGEFSEFAGVPLPGLVRLRPEATGAADVRLTATRVGEEGRLRLRAPGLASWSYTLEASEDLRTWTAGETKVASSNAVEFDVSVGGAAGQRFYRLSATPPR